MPGFCEADLVDMMDLLDTDGDGTVSKSEFKMMFTRVNPMSDAAFEQEWKKIDRNGDNLMSLSELCDYYGVSVSSVESGVGERKSMSDEKVLELLQLQAAIFEENSRREQAETAKKLRQANTRNAATGLRDGVQLVSLEEPTAPPGLEAERRVMEYCAIGEFGKLEAALMAPWSAEVSGSPSTLNLRIEDGKGEMPIHKLARKGALSPLLRLLECMDQTELKVTSFGPPSSNSLTFTPAPHPSPLQPLPL